MFLSAWEQGQTDLEHNLLEFDLCQIDKRERSSSFFDLLSSSTCSNTTDFNTDPYDEDCNTQFKDPSFNVTLSPHILDDYTDEEPKIPVAFQILVPTTLKRIGALTPEERKLKILKFQEKKKRRHYGKRVNYNCRKQVADKRLRVKGRFIRNTQATPMTESD